MKGPIGYGLWGRMGGMVVPRLRAMRTPEQQIVDATLEKEKVNEIVSKQDARYDSMTQAERDEYYMKPKLLTRLKKALRGQ